MEMAVVNLKKTKLLLVAVVLIYSCGFATTQRCPAFEDVPPGGFCSCDPGDNFKGWLFSCYGSALQSLFDIKYVVDSEITFRCGDEEPYKPALLQQLDLSQTKTYVFKSCQLPNTSFYQIFPDHHIEQLKFEMKKGDKAFTDTLFKNISHSITSLFLNNNGIRNLTENFFNSFVHLKFLSLSDNKLKTLPDKIFWELPNLVVLEITNNELEKLPENIFQGLFQLEKLYLYKNKLKRLPDTIFQSLVNLKVLDLADNHLILLPDDIFVGLPQLIHIRLRGNWLEYIPKELFNYTANLREIDLSLNRIMEPLPEKLLFGLKFLENISIHDCNLTHIHENFFSQCPNITHLRLHNNGLTLLPENVFKSNLMLKEVNLNFNYISELPQNLFPNQKRLEKLYLFKNNISSIPAGFFRHARNVKTLVLGRNRITNASKDIFRDLPELESLDLSINNLSHFSLDFNEHIKYIDLSYNSLTKMPDFKWLQHLKFEDLNMEYNKLTSLSIPVLYSTNKRNPSLNFGHNNIKSVSVQEVLFNDAAIKNLPSKDYENYVETTISLYPNPFICDCNLYSFYDYLQRSNEAHKRSARFTLVQNFTCQEPLHLHGRRVVLLSGEEFTCDIKNNCSDPCQCYYRAEDKARIMNCSGQKLKDLPNQVPYNVSILDFRENYLTKVEKFNDPKWQNLTELYLDKNKITSLHSWQIPRTLKNLTLRGNYVRMLPSSLLNYFANVSNFQISLSNNPWSCNCSTMYFKKWLTEHYQIVNDLKQIYCSNRIKQNGTVVRMSVVTVPDDIICPISDWPYKVQMISVTTVCVILALLLFVVSVLYYRNKQTVIAYVFIHFHHVFMCFFNEEDIDEDKVFDAFVSYSSSDQDIALKLLEELENKEPFFKLCIHERNWLPGNLISWNIINSVQNSRKTILVISKEFLESMWFQVEFRTAYYQMLEDKIDRLIVIVKGELPPKDMLDKDLQYLLSTKTYLIWEEKWFWEKLKYAMPHKKKELISSDVLALKDRPNSDKVRSVEHQITVLSSGNKTTDKMHEVVQNGTNKALNLVNKELSQRSRSPNVNDIATDRVRV